MAIVAKAFNTFNRRFKVGAVVTQADVEDFEARKESGCIVDEVTPPAPADVYEPVAKSNVYSS